MFSKVVTPAAAGHRLVGDGEGRLAARPVLERHHGVGEAGGQPRVEAIAHVGDVVSHADTVVDDVGDGDAGPNGIGREAEHLQIAVVADDQPLVRVEHAEAVLHVVERGLEPDVLALQPLILPQSFDGAPKQRVGDLHKVVGQRQAADRERDVGGLAGSCQSGRGHRHQQHQLGADHPRAHIVAKEGADAAEAERADEQMRHRVVGREIGARRHGADGRRAADREERPSLFPMSGASGAPASGKPTVAADKRDERTSRQAGRQRERPDPRVAGAKRRKPPDQDDSGERTEQQPHGKREKLVDQVEVDAGGQRPCVGRLSRQPRRVIPAHLK